VPLRTTHLGGAIYNYQMTKPSVFSLLSKASNSNSAKRGQSRKKKSFSDPEYPEVTSNMIGPSTTPSKSKGKQLAFSSAKLDTERSSGLKEVLIKPKGIYWHIQIRTEAVVPIDYNSPARGTETDDEHSAIVGSHSSNTYRETESFAYMADISKEINWKFEEQARVQ